jgi:glycosyltransferase involved in cell wall biosynthesis
MWSFTGHCSYSYDCERWRQGCGHCPYPETYPAVQWDNTAIERWLKKQVYARSRLTIITPSLWLATLARQSILSPFSIHTIPYGIDTQVYQPMDKAKSRRLLGLQQDEIVLMLASADLNDFRKGMDITVRLLSALPHEVKKKILLYAIGKKNPALEEMTGIRTIQSGYIEDDSIKVRCYTAADIFISTTRADNLPLVLQESLACGTPMLASAVGGTTEIVRQGITGFTAPLNDLEQMTSKLIELIQNNDLRQNMSARCRQIAVEEYDLNAIVGKHRELYESLTTK